MNRRTFLKSFIAVVVSPGIPAFNYEPTKVFVARTLLDPSPRYFRALTSAMRGWHRNIDDIIIGALGTNET